MNNVCLTYPLFVIWCEGKSLVCDINVTLAFPLNCGIIVSFLLSSFLHCFTLCYSEAMKNTINVVAKIKRMTNRLLISGGYVDRLGRRRQPPTIIEGLMFICCFVLFIS